MLKIIYQTRQFQAYHSAVSPPNSHDMLSSTGASSGLPPMNSFRGGQPGTPSGHYSSSSPTVNGGDMGNPPGSSQQTGDAIGKAFASVSNRCSLSLSECPRVYFIVKQNWSTTSTGGMDKIFNYINRAIMFWAAR